jgi:hypothetical protein
MTDQEISETLRKVKQQAKSADFTHGSKTVWTSRMKNLKNEGVYLIDYIDLTV